MRKAIRHYHFLPAETLETRRLLSSVSGAIFNDTNANGSRDPGALGVAGVVVYADDNGNQTLDIGEASTNTDSSGAYLLDELGAGDHRIAIQTPNQWQLTSPGTGWVYGIIRPTTSSLTSIVRIDPSSGAILT